MPSLNEVLLIGNLGRDPEYRVTPAGDGQTLLSIATTRRWRDKESGGLQSETDWHRVLLYGRLAEVARDYLSKGRSVYVCGRLHTRKWEKDGQTRYTTEIIASEMQMLDAPESEEPMSEDQKQWVQSMGDDVDDAPASAAG